MFVPVFSIRLLYLDDFGYDLQHFEELCSSTHRYIFSVNPSICCWCWDRPGLDLCRSESANAFALTRVSRTAQRRSSGRALSHAVVQREVLSHRLNQQRISWYVQYLNWHTHTRIPHTYTPHISAVFKTQGDWPLQNPSPRFACLKNLIKVTDPLHIMEWGRLYLGRWSM